MHQQVNVGGTIRHYRYTEKGGSNGNTERGETNSDSEKGGTNWYTVILVTTRYIGIGELVVHIETVEVHRDRLNQKR